MATFLVILRTIFDLVWMSALAFIYVKVAIKFLRCKCMHDRGLKRGADEERRRREWWGGIISCE